MVNSPFNEDPKTIIFFQGGPNFGGGTAGKFREMDNNRDIYCYVNRKVVNFERGYQPLSHGTKILVMPQFSNMPDQIFGKKNEKTQFSGQNLTFL